MMQPVRHHDVFLVPPEQLAWLADPALAEALDWSALTLQPGNFVDLVLSSTASTSCGSSLDFHRDSSPNSAASVRSPGMITESRAIGLIQAADGRPGRALRVSEMGALIVD